MNLPVIALDLSQMLVFQDSGVDELFAVRNHCHVFKFQEICVVLSRLHVQNIFDAYPIITFFVEPWLVCDDHTTLQRTRVWLCLGKRIVWILVDGATVTNAVTYAMREVTADLPKVFSGKRLKATAHGFLRGKGDLLKIKVAHENTSVHFSKTCIGRVLNKAVREDKSPCGVCCPIQVVSTSVNKDWSS